MIEDNKNNTEKTGVLTEYILNALKNDFSKEIIDKYKYISATDLLDLNKVTEVFPGDKISYLLLVAKLETLINILDILEHDDNIVYCDEFNKDSKKFRTDITNALKITIKETQYE